MGICCINEEDEKKSSRRATVVTNNGRTSISMSETVSNNTINWKEELSAMLERADPKDYQWQPYLKEALDYFQKLKEDPQYRKDMFSEVKSASQEFPSDGKGLISNRPYRKVLKSLEKQISVNGHPFFTFHSAFDHYVSEKYASVSNSYKKTAKLVDDMVDVIQIFSFIIILYYGFEIDLIPENSELFIRPVSSLFFRDNTLKILKNFIKSELENDNLVYQRQLLKFRTIQLKHLKVSSYFLFDQQFRLQIAGIPIQREKNELEAAIRLATEELNQIREMNTPTKKLSQLSKFRKSIAKSIEKFWEGSRVPKDKLLIDGDSLLSFLIFSIIKANYYDMLVEHHIMETFITESERKSKKGYNLITLQIACEWIKNQNASNFTATDIHLEETIKNENRELRASIFLQPDRRKLLRPQKDEFSEGPDSRRVSMDNQLLFRPIVSTHPEDKMWVKEDDTSPSIN